MAGISTELAVATQLAAKVIGKKLRGQITQEPDLDHFEQQFQALLDSKASKQIKRTTWVDLSAKQAPWISSHMSLSKGDQVTCFVEGRLLANTLLDVRMPLKIQIWCKIGDGDIFRGTQDDHSFTAQNDGVLHFGNYFPNDWLSPKGDRMQDDKVYKSCSGKAKILIIQWQGSALEGLRELASSGHELKKRISDQITTLQNGDITPKGWHYLWNIGSGEIFKDATNHHSEACIHCHTHGDTSILQKSVDLPLNSDSEISWRWCIDQLLHRCEKTPYPVMTI